MSTDPLPTAVAAGLPPPPKISPWPILAPILAALLSACVWAPCGSGVTWLMMRGGGAAVNVEKKNPGDGKGDKVVNGKKLEEWGFQDIQDHLAAKGMKTGRIAGPMGMTPGMWYEPGDGPKVENPLNFTRETEPDLRQGHFKNGCFFVEQTASSDEAKRASSRILDVQQRKTLPWNKYLFHGSDATLEKLKAILP